MQIPSTTSIVIFSLSIGSLGGVIVLKGDEDASKILYAICLTIFVSSIFYVATVFIPEARRKERFRRGLRKQYRSFKRRCIDIFLISSNSQDYTARENLIDPYEFRRYFLIVRSNSQSRWDLVATSIDDQDYIFDEIVRELDYLNRELEYVRSSIDLDDEKVEDFFVNLNQTIHTIKSAKAKSDDYKYFCHTLWSMFTRWNIIDGQLEDDIIERMIERI